MTAALAPTVPQLPDGLSCGVDVVDVARIAGLLARRAAARDRLFTAAEQRDAVRDGCGVSSRTTMRRLAARFAAKEAVVKLLGRPHLRWTDIEIVTAPDGRPSLHVLGAPTGMAVSLSHDGDVAIAIVIRHTASPLTTTES